jgi:DNA-binding SARP family transcriptional activator
MRFEVLGPIRAWSGSTEIAVTARREQILLGMLLLHTGRYVSVDLLIEAVWVHSGPTDAPTQIHGTVYRLRRRLAAAGLPTTVIVTEPAGYRAEIAPERVDLSQFRRLRDEAREAAARGDAERAAQRYRSALDLWRGSAFSGLDSQPLRDAATVLEEERLHALQERIRLDLANGMAGELVAELTDLAGQHPYREALHAALMLALYRADRQADALAAYQRLRRRLRDDLGTEPGADLQRLHRAIIDRDSNLSPARPDAPARAGTTPRTGIPPPAGASAAPVVPRQLPADVVGFTGRARQLAQLDDLLAAGAASVISAIDGTAGVGKTALAVHWAHRVADRFPDGQLYANLRGFDPGGQVMGTAETIGGFLDALGVPPERIPHRPEAQVGLYRSLLAGKRILVVLDNARDADQVRPLLPGGPTTLTVITSRNQLTPLVASTGAHPFTLGLLPPDEARALLAHRIGADRLAAEPDSVEAIIAGCARLPLALTIVAARARTGFPLPALAAQLAAAHRLEALDAGDAATQVRAVFSWSYAALSPPAARLFRLLGPCPGPEISAAAAASLAALPPARARAALAELTRSNLVTEHVPGRYGFHDLLRAYAAELARTTDPEPDRHAATARLLDHYLHTAHAAARLVYPGRGEITLAAAGAGVSPDRPAGYEQAMGWFAAEHAGLLAAVDHAAATGHDTHAWQLAWAVADFLNRQGHWHDWVATGHVAVAAADRLADPAAQAYAHRHLATAQIRLGRMAEAQVQLEHALERYRQAGDRLGGAHTHYTLGMLRHTQGRLDEALHHDQEALALYRSVDDRRGQALAHNAIGFHSLVRHGPGPALTHCRQALALFQALGDRDGQAHTWDSIGSAHQRLGQHAEAIDCYRQAIDLFRDRDRCQLAMSLVHLGESQLAAGDPAAARHAWNRALDILTDLAHPDAGEVRARLAARS